MKPGIVATLRINPRNCLSILDAARALNIPEESSFAQQANYVLGSLLEFARQQGMIPEPDTFNYNARMARYHQGKQTKKSYKLLKIAEAGGSDLRQPALPAVSQQEWAGVVKPVHGDLPPRGFAAQGGQPEPRQPSQGRMPAEDGAVPESALVRPSLPSVESLELSQARLTELLVRRDSAEDNPLVKWTASDEAEFQLHYKVVYPDG